MTFLLLVAVAGVWGIIFYRLFNAASAEDDYTFHLQEKPVEYESLDAYLPRKSAPLSLNYRDPFLVTEIKDTEPIFEEFNSKTPAPPPPRSVLPAASNPVVNWGIIKYKGFINNPGSKRLVGLVSVGEQEFMLGEGESAGGIKIVKNKRDSIQVLYQGQHRFIKLQ